VSGGNDLEIQSKRSLEDEKRREGAGLSSFFRPDLMSIEAVLALYALFLWKAFTSTDQPVLARNNSARQIQMSQIEKLVGEGQRAMWDFVEYRAETLANCGISLLGGGQVIWRDGSARSKYSRSKC